MLHINFHPFPVLHTERLVLRNLHHGDKHEMLEIRGNATTMQYVPRPVAQTVEDAVAVIDMITGFTARNERINWAITEKDKLIGVIGYVGIREDSMRAEVGYVLHHEHHGRGIAYEALQAVLGYGFQIMRLHSIEAIIMPDNAKSIRLIEKAGFVREGYFKDYSYHNNRFWDQLIYSLINPADLQQSPVRYPLASS